MAWLNSKPFKPDSQDFNDDDSDSRFHYMEDTYVSESVGIPMQDSVFKTATQVISRNSSNSNFNLQSNQRNHGSFNLQKKKTDQSSHDDCQILPIS